MRPYLPWIIINMILTIILVICFYFGKPWQGKQNSILEKDSIKYEKLNKKIRRLDSLNTHLHAEDSVLSVEVNKLKKKHETTKKNYTDNRTVLPVLPDY